MAVAHHLRMNRGILVVRLGLFFGALCLAIVAGQHYWISVPKPPSGGTAGVNAIAITDIANIPSKDFDLTPGESALGYVKRVTDMVHLSTYNCAPSEYTLSWLDRVAKKILRLPDVFTEGILVKSRFICGFCSQRAYLVHHILKKNGIRSDIYGLSGHVVDRVFYSDMTYYADPDYGVGPFKDGSPLNEIVRHVYSKAPTADLSLIAGLYTSSGDNGPYAATVDDAAGQPRGTYMENLHAQQVKLFSLSLLFFRLTCMGSVVCAGVAVLLGMPHRLPSFEPSATKDLA